MSPIIVIPQRSETLVSGQYEISESAATRLEKCVRLVVNHISTRWSSGKDDDFLRKLLTLLSVIYFIGAAGLACVLLLQAFNP
jgi:hypothetical protein